MTEADDPWANHIRGMVPITPLENGRDPLSLMSSTPPMQSTPKLKPSGSAQSRHANPIDGLESLEAKWGLDRSTEEGTISGRRKLKSREVLDQDRSPPPIEGTPNSAIIVENYGAEDDEEAFVYRTASSIMEKEAERNDGIIEPDTALSPSASKNQLKASSDPQQSSASLLVTGQSSDSASTDHLQDQGDISANKPVDYSRLSQLCSQGPLSSLQKFFEVTTSPSPAGSGISAFALSNEPNPASGLVPIHFAAREGKVELLKWLITEAGAIVEMEDKEGETALHKAALAGKLPALILLLSSGADANAKDGDGWTPLHNACSRGYLDIVKILIENSAAEIDVKGGRGSWTPLMNASSHGHLPIVRYLTNRQSADPLLRNAAGETAFDVAAATFEIYICELLEKYESDRWAALTLASTSTNHQNEGSSSSQTQSIQVSSSPYNPLVLHTTVPVVLHENQRLDTRLSTLAIRGGRPRWSGTQAGRPDKTDRRAPSTMPPGPLSLSRSKNVPMRREDVKLPTRKEPYKLKLTNRSAQIAAVKRARGEMNNEEYGSTPTPESIMNKSRDDTINGGEYGHSSTRSIQGQLEESSHFWLSDWQQDLTNPQVDANQGWQYSQSFDTPEEKWLATPPAPLLRLLEGRGLGQNMQRAVTGAMLGSVDTSSVGGEAEAVSTGWVRRRRWVRVMRRRLDIQFGDELEAAEQAFLTLSTSSKQVNGKGAILTSSSIFRAQQEARGDAEKLTSKADYLAKSKAMAGEAIKNHPRGQEELTVSIARLDLAVEELRSHTFSDDDLDRQSRAEKLLKEYTLQLGQLRQEAGLEEGSDDEIEDEEDAEFIYPNSYKDDGQSVITRIGTPSVTMSGIVPPRQRSATGEIEASLGATRSADLASAVNFRVPTNEMPTRPVLSSRPSLQEQVLLPTWENDYDVGTCRGCNRKFTFFLRKHHCRRCGRIHCDACSSHRAQLLPNEIVIDPGVPEMIFTEANGPTRICDTCDAERRLPSSIRNIHGMDALSNAVDQVDLQRDDSVISDVSSRASELNECPVCNVVLATLGDGALQEEHVRECLENGGGGSVQGGRYLIYKLAEGPIVGKECQICLEDLCVGMSIARLPCLCYYHRHCIDSWFSRGRSCPVHARSW